MSIDDMLGRDPRLLKLAKLTGWSRREVAGCLVLDIWPICYDRVSHVLSGEEIDLAAGFDGFAEHMIAAGLGVRVRDGIRVSGAKQRIGYLEAKREAGRAGGLKSGETRRNQTKQNRSTASSTPQAAPNPSVPDPVPDLPSVSAPVPEPEIQKKNMSASADAPPGLSVLKVKVDAATGEIGKRRNKPKPIVTSAEASAVTNILGKLSERSGVAYRGSDEHQRLILNQLRSGVTERDLRAVIAYCAEEKGWEGDPKMGQYLRPETLFGPVSIAKYLDPARTWAAKHYPESTFPTIERGDAEAEPAWMGGSQ